MGKSKDLATGAAYQDQTESDTRYVNASGDTMTGDLTVNAEVGIGRSPTSTYKLDVHGEVNNNWLAHIHNTHATSGYGVKIRAGDDNNVTAFRVSSQDNATTILDASGGGIVTTPNQPHIYGSVGNTGGTGSGGAGLCNRMYVQTSGGGMTFSNSRITVPVAGVYMVSWQTLTNQVGSGRYDTNVRLNGTDISNGLNNASDQNSDYRMRTHIFARDLAANDYLQFNHAHPYATGAVFDSWAVVSVFLLG